MAENDWKNRLGMVYSTNQDFHFIKEENEIDIKTLEPSKQKLLVGIDRKQRAGKQVTLIQRFIGKEEDLINLSKVIKTKCGVGGTCKDGEIIIQGDFRDKIVQILETMGYKAKRSN